MKNRLLQGFDSLKKKASSVGKKAGKVAGKTAKAAALALGIAGGSAQAQGPSLDIQQSTIINTTSILDPRASKTQNSANLSQIQFSDENFTVQGVSDSQFGTGGSATLVMGDKYNAVGGKLTATKLSQEANLHFARNLGAGMTGSAGVSTRRDDAKTALNLPDSQDTNGAQLSGTQGYVALDYSLPENAAGFTKFSASYVQGRSNSVLLNQTTTPFTTEDVTDFGSYTRNQTNTFNETKTTSWSGGEWKNINVSATGNLGENAEVTARVGRTDTQINGEYATRPTAGVTGTYYGGDYRVTTSIDAFAQGRRISADISKALDTNTSLDVRVQHTVAGDIPNTSVFAGMTYHFGSGKNNQYLRPNTHGTQTALDAVRRNLAKHEFQMPPLASTGVITTNTQDVLLSTSSVDTPKIPEKFQGSVIVNDDGSISIIPAVSQARASASSVNVSVKKGKTIIATDTQNAADYIHNEYSFDGKTYVTYTGGRISADTMKSGMNTLWVRTVNTAGGKDIPGPAELFQLTIHQDNETKTLTPSVISASENSISAQFRITDADQLSQQKMVFQAANGQVYEASSVQGDIYTFTGLPSGTSGIVVSSALANVKNPNGTMKTQYVETRTPTATLKAPEVITPPVPVAVDSPTEVTLFASNITTKSILAACNISDKDGTTGSCTLRDAGGKLITSWEIGDVKDISNLTPGAGYTLMLTGSAVKIVNGVKTDVKIEKLIDIKTNAEAVVPVDSKDTPNYPSLTITPTSVTFTGGSIADLDNPAGFNASIVYIVQDTQGNIVGSKSLTPDTAYTYQMQYNTWNKATNTLVLGKLSPAQKFRTEKAPIVKIDAQESITEPKLEISERSVVFSGGQVNDADNGPGFNTNIIYVVYDMAGNNLGYGTSGLTPNTKYAYSMLYETMVYDPLTKSSKKELREKKNVGSFTTLKNTVKPIIIFANSTNNSTQSLYQGDTSYIVTPPTATYNGVPIAVTQKGKFDVNTPGTYTIEFAATNDAGMAIATLKITVLPLATPTLAFGQGSVTRTEGDANFTMIANSDSRAPITYRSSNPAVAAVNFTQGVVNIGSAGETTIYADQAKYTDPVSGKTYAEKSAFYTLTVNAAPVVTPTPAPTPAPAPAPTPTCPPGTVLDENGECS